MCGIAGFCLNQDEKLDARKLSMSLLNEIASRGRDATGAAWVQIDKETKVAGIHVSKAPVPSRLFEPYLKSMPKSTRRAVLHTRWATQGSPQNNGNNHPIVSGKIVGVHNGVLSNDDAVFSHLGTQRRAEVDSEAAFALIDQTVYHPADVLRSLQGRAALAWLDARDKRDLHLARVDGSPLVLGATAKGSIVFASTMPLLVQGTQQAGVELSWVEEVEPMTYLRIRNGDIADCFEIGQSKKEIAS